MTTTAPTFASKLRALRLKRGISQEQLARRVDCALKTVSNYERGLVRKHDMALVKRIAVELGVPLEELA